MYFDPFLFVVFILNFDFFLCKSGASNSIKDQIQDYFNNVDTKSFVNAWSQYDLPLDSTITSELQYVYGHDAVVADVKMSLAPGFVVSDPTVDVLFKEMVLRDLPWIKSQVDIALPSNYLSIQGVVLNSMFVDTNYILLRNRRGSISTEKRSPFSRKQVKNKGPLTIIVDGCQVNGTAVVDLDGSSVSVRHSNVWLDKCSFSVEISSTGKGKPPIIAPYLSQAKREEMTRLLSRPIREALLTRLEAILYANIDAAKIFQGNVESYRNHQDNFFKITGDFMTSIIAELNQLTAKNNQGRVMLRASKELIHEKRNGSLRMKIYDAFLDGLENAYSPNAGGGYIVNNKTIISDALNFNSLKVNGKILFRKNSQKIIVIFFAELKDVAVNIELYLDNDQLSVRFEKWRDLEFFLKDTCPVAAEKQTADIFLTAYLSQEVPLAIQRYIKEELPTILKAKTKLSKVNTSSEGDYSTTSVEDTSLFSSPNNTNSSEDSVGEQANVDTNSLQINDDNATQTSTNKLYLKNRRSNGFNAQNKQNVKPKLKFLVQSKGKINKKDLSNIKLSRKTKSPHKKLSLKTNSKSKSPITRKWIKHSRKPGS